MDTAEYDEQAISTQLHNSVTISSPPPKKNMYLPSVFYYKRCQQPHSGFRFLGKAYSRIQHFGLLFTVQYKSRCD